MVKISKTLILYYYNLIGYDLNKLDITYLVNNVSEISDLIPDDLKDYPLSSQKISTLFLRVVDDLNYLLEKGEISYFIHQELISSLIIICDAGLKLIGERNHDYFLSFERQNEIIEILLKNIRQVKVMELIDLASLVIKSKFKEILKGNRFPYQLSFLLSLAITGYYDIGSEIFKEGSSEIDLDKLFITLQKSLNIYVQNLNLGIIREKPSSNIREPYSLDPKRSK